MLTIQNPFANPQMISGEIAKSPSHFLILGLGESGVAMTKWCLRNGAKVRLADTRDPQKSVSYTHLTLPTIYSV